MRHYLPLILLAFSALPACPQSIITTVAGGGSLDGLRADQAPVANTYGRAVGPDGSIYLVMSYRVYAIRPDGVIRLVAGTGFSGFSGDGGPAVEARLSGAYDVTVDKNNNVFIGDVYRIRRVSPNGIITTVAGNGYPAGIDTDGPALSSNVSPYRLAADSKGNVYFDESPRSSPMSSTAYAVSPPMASSPCLPAPATICTTTMATVDQP